MNTKHRALAADRSRASHIDNLLDEALKQIFPASDPIAIAVEAVHVPYAGPSVLMKASDRLSSRGEAIRAPDPYSSVAAAGSTSHVALIQALCLDNVRCHYADPCSDGFLYAL